jgi:DNA-binding NarL/FixJ family response regulator
VEPNGHRRNLVLLDTVDPEGVSGPQTIRVLIAYADKLARAGLNALLHTEADMAVVGSVADGLEAVALGRRLRPDVLLVYTTMPGIDAVEVTRQIISDSDSSAVHVLVLGASDHDELILSSLRAGASGFLSRDAEPGELIDGIRTVAAGEAALSPGGARRVIAELASHPDPRLPAPEQLDELTAREREVVALVASGMSNDEVAEQLVVTRATAKTHVSRAMAKLCVHSRAQLVTLAYETGLVLPRRLLSPD